MIRFQCDKCGKQLAVQDSKAGALVACPGCKEKFRVPSNSPALEALQQPRPSPANPIARPTASEQAHASGGHGEEAQEPSPPEPDQGPEEEFAFSRGGLRKALWWFLSIHFLALIVMVGAPIGCVVLVVKEPLSLQMLMALVFVGGTGLVGFCFFIMSLPNWRLFFFSTIPSSSHYRVTGDRLQRYARDGKLVEEILFANVAAVRLITKRNVENPEITAKVLGIDLRNPVARGTILDQPFCQWSRKLHDYDLAMVDDFFEVPVKKVYRTIKKHWQLWQETHPVPDEAEGAQPAVPRRQWRPWYKRPLPYVLGGVGVCALGGLILLVSMLSRRQGGEPAPGPGPGPGPAPGPPQAQQGAPEPLNPRSLAGLLAYWPLDEAQGKKAGDEVTKGSFGQIHGGEWAQGVKGSALKLDGKRDFVDLGPAPGLNFGPAAPFTLAGWVATESNVGVICSFRRKGAPFPVIELSVRQGQLAGWVRDDTSGKGGAKVTGNSVNDGKWHHVALIRSGDGTIELFLDGVSQGHHKGDNSGGPITTDLRALGCDRLLMVTGKKAPGFLAGSFDEFCVYNRPLPPAEITVLAGGKK